MGTASEPGAGRGPRAGSPCGVENATGSGGTFDTEWGFLIRSLPLPVLTRIARRARRNLPVSVRFGNNAYAYRINQREPAPGAINPKGVMK